MKTDISCEEARVYHFVGEDGRDTPVTIEDPDTLVVTEAGEHWITAEDKKIGFVIPPGWTHYEVFPRYGHKPFDTAVPMLFLPVPKAGAVAVNK
jgi:hypothetical protein